MRQKGLYYLFILNLLISLFSGCGIQEIKQEVKEIVKVDKSAPEITNHSIETENDRVTFTFTASEKGKILYEQRCRGNLKEAKTGQNTIIFDNLPDGLYDFCTVTILDRKGNASKTIRIPPFVIQQEEVPKIEKILSVSQNEEEYFLFRSSQDGQIIFSDTCSADQKFAKLGNNRLKIRFENDYLFKGCTIQIQNRDGVFSNSLLVHHALSQPGISELDTETTPVRLATLDDNLQESSGLITIDGRIFTHNDSDQKPVLYEIDILGQIQREIKIENAAIHDWEDIAQDDRYVYIGDIGNNLGNRKDLTIYKIEKEALLTKESVSAQKIYFKYSDQNNFTYNNFSTPFDAEALISYKNHLYIFTKNWENKITRVYKLPKESGSYTIEAVEEQQLDFYVTGADYNQNIDALVLTGYGTKTAAKPHLIFYYDFHEDHFFEGESIDLQLTDIPRGFRQIEAVCFYGDDHLLLSSERFNFQILGNYPQSLFFVSLRSQ